MTHRYRIRNEERIKSSETYSRLVDKLKSYDFFFLKEESDKFGALHYFYDVENFDAELEIHVARNLSGPGAVVIRGEDYKEVFDLVESVLDSDEEKIYLEEFEPMGRE